MNRDQLPPDAVMREMARFALETATESIARTAEEYAAMIRAGKFGTMLSPADALLAFAAAIRATNRETFGQPSHNA